MGWIIRDKKRFASEVLPKHFAKQSKFTSFTRKLNRWYVRSCREILVSLLAGARCALLTRRKRGQELHPRHSGPGNRSVLPPLVPAR
jgi:hypothetical protein